LEDNPTINLSLADKRRAFDEYRTKWDAFSPIQKWEREVDNPSPNHQVSGPGVYGLIANSRKFVEFSTLELDSRGIPREEWKVPLPDFTIVDLAINPHADVLVVVESRAK